MAGSKTFKCPGCGAYLEFDPTQQQFACPYCGYVTEQLVTKPESVAEQEAIDAAAQKLEEMSHLLGYHCQNCGAEIVTEQTTAATRCYYCHSPVVLSDRLSGEFRPDSVLPFKLSREEAITAFKAYLKKKRFVDSRFLDPANLEDFSGVYYPYWVGELGVDTSFKGEGTQVSTVPGPRETIITTSYFDVERVGHANFSRVIRKALSKADRLLSDGIHPYDPADVKVFNPSYLSGFLAEARDIPQQETIEDMKGEVQGYAQDMISAKGKYSTIKGHATTHVSDANLRYTLLPAWVLTYRAPGGKQYFYMMNGQTGKVCGKLPVNKGKLLITALIAGAVVAALLCLGGAFVW